MKTVFTTGEAAKICKVSQQTIIRCFDSGQLKGFRVAGSRFRRIPRDVLVVCVGKSTYARCGLIVNVTPLEPTWEGYLTLEISNTTPLPAKVYGGEGIAQLLFFEGDEEPEVAYADRKGKYMKQVGVTLPRM